jgi:hypothetical protein
MKKYGGLNVQKHLFLHGHKLEVSVVSFTPFLRVYSLLW